MHYFANIYFFSEIQECFHITKNKTSDMDILRFRERNVMTENKKDMDGYLLIVLGSKITNHTYHKPLLHKFQGPFLKSDHLLGRRMLSTR